MFTEKEQVRNIFGRAIRDFADRDEVIIATKVFFGDGLHEGRNTNWFVTKSNF